MKNLRFYGKTIEQVRKNVKDSIENLDSSVTSSLAWFLLFSSVFAGFYYVWDKKRRSRKAENTGDNV